MTNGYTSWNELNLIFKLEHLKEIEMLLENTNSLWEKRYQELLAQADSIEDEDIKTEFYDFYFEELQLMSETLPRINRYGLFSNLFSFLEYNILVQCKEAIRTLSIDNEIKGHYFSDYIIFLRENVSLQLISVDIEQEVEFMRIIRNRILHSNGKVDVTSEKKQHVEAKHYVESNPLLRFSDDKHILLSDEYIRKCLQLVEGIITEIHSAIYSKE